MTKVYSKFLFMLIAIGTIFGCSDNDKSSLCDLEVYEPLKVIYSSAPCCTNMIALEEVFAPDSCGTPYAALFAFNLDEFEIEQSYDFGDTLTITYALNGDCEAQGNDYDCDIICDLRHGIPIQILSIEAH